MGEIFGDRDGYGKKLTLLSAKRSTEGLAIWRRHYLIGTPSNSEEMEICGVLPPRPYIVGRSYCRRRIPSEM